jgi:long-chain acyl-CoA synthetase
VSSENKCVYSPQGSLQAFLSRAAEDFPEKTALTYGNCKFTYRELEEFSSRFAGALGDLGVATGDRVALFLPNSPHFVIAYFGVLKAGAVVTAVNPLHKKREVEAQLCDAGAQTMVVLDTLYPIVEKLANRASLKNVIITSADFCQETANVSANSDVSCFWDLIKKGGSNRQRQVLDFSPDDLAVLQYTGGTTGVPKGVMLSHANLVSNACSFASWLKGASDDVFLSVLPFFHVYGMTASLNAPVSLGVEIVLTPKFDPEEIFYIIEHHHVSVFCGSPTMFAMLLENSNFKKYSFSSVRICISGASFLPAHVQKGFMQAGVFLVEGYGLTEASPVTHCTPVNTSWDAIKIGSVGVSLPGTEARIVDLETGQKRLSAGERGELSVRGPQVMQGYWQRREETAQILKGGWLLTGDIAYVDKEGYFYIIGRKKELIKHKDYSVYPGELEKVLQEHPDIKVCAVIGKSDPLLGETLKAFVVLKDSVKTSGCSVKEKEKELLQFVNSQTASYKVIKEIEIRRELPTSPSGKILKHQLTHNTPQPQQ